MKTLFDVAVDKLAIVRSVAFKCLGCNWATFSKCRQCEQTVCGDCLVTHDCEDR
jgi:hypothetical protein